MFTEELFIHARHCPEHTEAVAKSLADSLQHAAKYNNTKIGDLHTLVVERRYHESDAIDPSDGIVFILLGDDDPYWNERRIVLGWGRLFYMQEMLRLLSETIPFTNGTDTKPVGFRDMDDRLKEHLLSTQLPMEWKRCEPEWLDQHVFAVGLNGQRPHAPFDPSETGTDAVGVEK